MVTMVTPVEVLPAEPCQDFQATYRLDGDVRRLNVAAASHYEVWLIVKRIYPTTSVVAILLVAV